MLGEATLDVSGTFLGEAIRLLILFAAQHFRSASCERDAMPLPRNDCDAMMDPRALQVAPCDHRDAGVFRFHGREGQSCARG